MIAIELTYKQARMAKEFLQDGKEYASTHNQDDLKRAMEWNSDLSESNGKIYYTKFFEGIWYRYILENMTASNNFTISNGETTEEYNIEEIEDILKDVNEEDFLLTLDITPLEKYISKLVGFDVLFIRNLKDNNLYLTTNNIVEHAGCMKPMLSELYIKCRGIHFYIDKDTGEQVLSVPDIEFRYEHSHGGSNGYTFADVWYDIKMNTWKAYNYKARKYEVI